jgi:predicted nucleic acid-binding protein
VIEYVIDTGVLARWYLEQPGYEHAREIRGAFLTGEVSLVTADTVPFELADVLRRKGFVPGWLDRTEYLAAVRGPFDLGVDVHVVDADRLERAATLAVDRHVQVFDAVLVDLALRRGTTLLTADAKLHRGQGGSVPIELLRGSVPG